MLPQPFVTVAQTKMPELKTVIDLTKEWDAIGTGGKLITSGIFVRSDFLESNKELVDEFLSNYTDSVKWINENVEDASKLVGDEMKKDAEEYLKTLFDADPKSVGGALPGEEFYYTGK